MKQLSREEFLDQLVDDINEEAERLNEYVESEESCHAEYCGTFGYNEGPVDREQLTDEARELVKLIPKGRVKEALQECSNLEFVGVYSQENEVFRCPLGEIEHQIGGELLERIKSLTDEEFEKIRSRVDIYMHDKHKDLLYSNHDYDAWVLILDEEKLEAWLTENKLISK